MLDVEHYFRTSVEKFKRKRIMNELSASLRKEEKTRNREMLSEKRRYDENVR